MENMNERTTSDHIVAQALETTLGSKVEKEDDKALSSNDYTDAEKEKLAELENGANAYVLPIASVNTLGGIKIGNNLTIDETGKLHATASGGGIGKSYPESTGDETFNSYDRPNSNVAS